MAALTPTLVNTYSLGGGTNSLKIFTVTPQADGDTVDLTDYFDTIDHAEAVISAGQDAALSFVSVAESSGTLTITQLEQDGTAATDWTGAELTLKVYGSSEGTVQP